MMIEPCIWTKPALTRAGQLKFWERQYGVYENAEMTVDNQGEMDAVLEVCEGIKIDDIITFGGAVGCRDPLMIFKDSVCTNNNGSCIPPNRGLIRAYFNDLSPALLGTAKDCILANCHDCGADITYHPGAIVEVAGQLPSGLRTLILGVYSTMAFFVPNPARGYPAAGFDEYIANHEILGDHFWHDYLVYNGQAISTIKTGLELNYNISPNDIVQYRSSLMASTHQKLIQQRLGIIALQTIGVRPDQEGYFVSSWFDQAGLNRLIGNIFPPDEYNVEVKTFPKGFLYAINRIGVAPTGIVTMLNNVFGNVIPTEQLSTLEAVRSLI